MASAQLRDKLMAKLILEEIIGKTLVEANGSIVPLSSMRVAGFDQDIYVTDLLEDYGWLGSWMHLSEINHKVSPGSSKLFKESYSTTNEWLGGIKPENTKDSSEDHTPRVMSGNEKSEISMSQHVSFGRTLLLLRMSLLQTLSVTSDNKVEVSMPAYQERIIDEHKKESERSLLPDLSHDEIVGHLFFSKIRNEVNLSLAPRSEAEPSKES